MRSALVFCRATTAFIAVVAFSLTSLASLAADLEVGKAKAQVCIACHGPDGNSINPEFPSLSGQPAQAISTALFRFREGNRKNTVMSPFAANLSNRDMNDIAAYFASIKRVSQHVTQPVNSALGPELAKKYNCTQCHGPELKGLQHIPRIAGQQYSFLIMAIREFKAQTRSDMDGNMSSAASILSDADIVALADYIAALGDNSRP